VSAARSARTWIVLVAGLVFVSLFARVGADTYWLVSLGDRIRETGAVPEGVPFAFANTSGWPNGLILAELILSLAAGWGAAGLVGLQLLVNGGALALLAAGARRSGASDRATAASLAIAIVGALPALVVVKLQIFSLIPFVLLLLLLRAQHRRPTRAIWFAPLLVALWTNLHGAVLLGVAVFGAYLLFSRLRTRPIETLLVGPTTVLALLATPQGLHTIDYYRDVMGNEAAAHGAGMWARLSLTNPFDVVLMVAAALLLVAALRRRLPVWEYVVLLGLVVATATASRHGIWVILAAAGPAACGFTRGSTEVVEPSARRGTAWTAVLGAGAGLLLAIVVLPQRGADQLGVSPALVDAVAAQAADRVVLAPEPLVESLAAAGVTVWASNPIDAFHHDVQRAYLDFIDDGKVDGALKLANGSITAIVVLGDSDAARAIDGRGGFERSELPDGWLLYLLPRG
jgi:hypothetical protein